jgi:hypothetical protein
MDGLCMTQAPKEKHIAMPMTAHNETKAGQESFLKMSYTPGQCTSATNSNVQILTLFEGAANAEAAIRSTEITP